ncbi:hypothetical protein LINPERPRIM_LOCUS20428 [Linum perenne]
MQQYLLYWSGKVYLNINYTKGPKERNSMKNRNLHVQNKDNT